MEPIDDKSSAATDFGDEGSSSVSRRAVLQLASAVIAQTTWPAATSAAVPDGQIGNGFKAEISLNINGRRWSGSVDTRQSLLDVLREELRLTGTKKGCNQGACGACTVLIGGKRVVSCLTLAAMQDGVDIVTIEGLMVGEDLHPLQAAFVDHDALQCGFCTPGHIMSGIGCISEGHAGSPEEIKAWMSGNLCRCGAYPGIVAAISDVAGRP